MRAFSIVVVLASLVAWIGYKYLGDSAVHDPALQAGAVQGAGKAAATESGEPMAVVAAWMDGGDAAAAPAKSTLYQWVDERGSVNFAASLEEVPAAWRDRAGKVELDAGSFTMTKSGSSGAKLSRRPTTAPTRNVVTAATSAPDAAPDAAPNRAHDVTVYTAPWCGWCRKTLAFLDERGVDYVNKDIEADSEYESELREKTGGTSIPLVEIDGTEIRGFNAGRMDELLK